MGLGECLLGCFCDNNALFTFDKTALLYKSLILSPAKSAKCMYRDSHTIPLQGFNSITSLQAICSCVNINYKE